MCVLKILNIFRKEKKKDNKHATLYLRIKKESIKLK